MRRPGRRPARATAAAPRTGRAGAGARRPARRPGRAAPRVVPGADREVGVGVAALGGHRLGVQQQRGVLRDQPDEPDELGRRQVAAGPGRATRTRPADGRSEPDERGQSRVDLPAPLRPISAVTLAAGQVEVDAAQGGDRGRVARRAGRTRADDVAGAGSRGRGWRDARRRGRRAAPTARRRASRTDSGSGVQPVARPRPMTGGKTGEVRIASAGSSSGDVRPSPTSSTRSAWWMTRSSRCSASTTVMPEVVHEPVQRGQDVLGRHGVQGRGRLVEHEDARDRRRARRAIATRCCWPPERSCSGAAAQRRPGRAGRGSPRPGGASRWRRRPSPPCRRRSPPRRCR